MPYNNTTPQQAVILFTRYPQAGKVKTRLIEELGPLGAATLHDQLTKEVISKLQPILNPQKAGFIQLQVLYCGGTEQEITQWLGNDIQFARQHGNDLGERMQHAFEQSWQQGTKQVLLIGSDCPAITASIINQGLEHLHSHDLVLGPAVDGGYYLIGLNGHLQKNKKNYARLFQNIDWGTERVLAQTLAQAKKSNLSFTLLPELHDIDRPEDLVHFNHYSGTE
jgi:hypothetical protein